MDYPLFKRTGLSLGFVLFWFYLLFLTQTDVSNVKYQTTSSNVLV